MRKEEEKKRVLLEKKIKKVLNKDLSKQEYIDWKTADNKLVANLIDYFLQKGDDYKKSVGDDIVKGERVISKKKFDKSMGLAGLPYEIIAQRANSTKNIHGAYRIQEKSDTK